MGKRAMKKNKNLVLWSLEGGNCGRSAQGRIPQLCFGWRMSVVHAPLKPGLQIIQRIHPFGEQAGRNPCSPQATGSHL